MKSLTHSFSFVFDHLFFKFLLNDSYSARWQYSSTRRRYLQNKDVVFDVNVQFTSKSKLSLFSIKIDSSLFHCLWCIQFNLNSICSIDKVSIVFNSEIIESLVINQFSNDSFEAFAWSIKNISIAWAVWLN